MWDFCRYLGRGVGEERDWVDGGIIFHFFFFLSSFVISACIILTLRKVYTRDGPPDLGMTL